MLNAKKDFLRVLIIKPSALGDVATTLPMLCDLHRAYPEAKIDWLVHPGYTALLEGHEYLHEVIPFERKKLSSWWYNPAAFLRLMKLLGRLRQARYDLVIDAQGLLRSGFFTRVTGAQVRLGFAHAREGAAWAYTHTAKLPDAGKKMVAVERMRALVGPLDVKAEKGAEFRVPFSPQATREAADMLSGLGVSPEYVVVIPGARWDTKRWPADRYAELIVQLLEQHHVVLMGSPDEKALCDEIARLAAPRPASAANSDGGPNAGEGVSANLVNVAGRTSLAQMIALLSRASLVIGNDSGPLHVAVALGRPIVGIYGPTDPNFVGPYGQLNHVVRFDVECHPCRRKTCDHHSCMAKLTRATVWEKVREVLSEAPS